MWATMAFADPDGVLDPGPPVLLSSCSPVPVLLSSRSSGPPILGVGGMRGAVESAALTAGREPRRAEQFAKLPQKAWGF